MKKINSVRNLFEIKFSKVITDDTLVMNIDEASISRNTKTNYSWGLKGKDIEVWNFYFIDSVNIIAAIWSNGAWISMILNLTIFSTNFTWFLRIICKWLKSYNCFKYRQVIILLDNWPVHKSNIAIDCLEKIRYLVYFILAYSPNFVPVEMCFILIKRKLCELCKRETIKLTLKENYSKIYDSLLLMKSCIVKKMFGEFYKKIRTNF